MEEKPMADKDEGREEEENEQSALLPKSLMAGKDFKPGDEIVLKVNHVYEDEFEVSYAKEEKPSKPKSSMEQADAAMDRMATMKDY